MDLDDELGDQLPAGCNSIVIFVVAVILVVSSIVFGIRDIQFKMAGKTASATVTSSWERPTDDKMIRISDYEFEIDGRTYSGQTEGLSTDQTLTVEYLANSPSTNRVAGTQDWYPLGLTLLLVSIPMFIVGTFLFRRNTDLLTD